MVETVGDKVAVGASCTQVNDRKVAHAAPRGVSDLWEGNARGNAVQERLRHETRPWNARMHKPLGR